MNPKLWEVFVGNLGRVYAGNGTTAKRTLAEYREQSRMNYGRAAGENVELWCDGELCKEHVGTLSKNEQT